MIGSYLSVLRRRAGAIAVLTALLTPLLYLALTAGGQKYESGAVIQTGSNIAANVVGLSVPYEAPESRLATEVEFFESDIVAERARESLAALGWTESRQELRDQVSISPRGVSPLLDVIGVHSDPERAQQLTDAFVNAYVSHRRDLQQNALQAVVADLEAQREAAAAELAALGDPDTASPAVAQEIASAQSWYDTLTGRLEEARLRTSVDTSGVALLSPASAPEPVEQIGPAIAGPIALLGALLAACGIALLVDVLRDPVRTRDEAQALLAVPALGELPQLGTRQHRRDAALSDPTHPAVAGARGVRLRLERLRDGRTPRTVLVVAAPSDGDDAVTIATSLAASWVGAGLRAAVVTDIGRHHAALTQLLKPTAELQPVASGLSARATNGGVWVVPATRDAQGHPGFLDHASPAAVLDELHRTFDIVVLVDSRSSALDAVSVSHLVDATVLVCALGRTPAKRFQQLVHTLADYGARVDGVVLTRPWWNRRADERHARNRAAHAHVEDQDRAGHVPAGGPAGLGMRPTAPVTVPSRSGAGHADRGSRADV